jgi:hypothetical protein
MAPWNLIKFSDNSEKRTALIFSRQSQQEESLLGLCFGPEDGGTTSLHTFDKLLPEYTAPYPRNRVGWLKDNVIDLLFGSNPGRQSGYYDWGL